MSFYKDFVLTTQSKNCWDLTIVDTCEPVMNTLSVDWRQGLRAECFQSVINPNIESSDDGLNFEEDVDDVIAINSKSAVIQEIGNSVLAILDKSHEVLFR